MRSNKIFFLALFSILAITFTACKNDSEEPTPDEKVMVGFEFDYLVDGEAYDTSKVYTINGTAVKFSIANFYVGGITFMTEEGVPTEVKDKYLLVTPTSGMQEVSELEKGHYHMARFFIGVDPETNSQTETDFTSRDANDPLSLQFPTMHWSWNTGYKFIRIDGKVDTDADGVPDEVMSFHLGNDDMLKTLEFVTHKDVEEGEGHMHFEFDLATALAGIDLAQDHFTHVDDFPELATAFRNNLSSAFKYTHQ
ncbi:MAG: hypothetical protein KDD19_03840 [Phaeodactylibacter sp.]|nr:hypothetical protein [Phaeodactylibacter sp.]MCB9053449.1 hypothetical protein [Lewinellaceae bacterium]